MTEFLFMKDAEANYVREFEAVVTDAGTDPSNGNFIVLDRTAFYAEGGGQPSDTGTITWEGGSKTAKVKLVTKKGGVKHFIDGETPSKGASVHGWLDWENRYALMRYHTGQHLISSVVYDLYNGAHTAGNQIYSNKSRIDFHPVKFGEEDLKKIEDECNRRISLKPAVKIYEAPREEIEKRSDSNRANLELLPKSINLLRIVEIDGFDIVPCAGTHVRSLSELGKLKITARETKGAEKERVTFELKME